MASIPETSPLTSYVFQGEFDVRNENPNRKEYLLTEAPQGSTVVYMCHTDRKISVLTHLEPETSIPYTFAEIQKALYQEHSKLRFSGGFKAVIIDDKKSPQTEAVYEVLKSYKVVVYGRTVKKHHPTWSDLEEEMVIRDISASKLQLVANTSNCGDIEYWKDEDMDKRFAYIQGRENEKKYLDRSSGKLESLNHVEYAIERANRTNENIPKFDASKPWSKIFQDELHGRLKVQYSPERKTAPLVIARSPSLNSSSEMLTPPAPTYQKT